MEIVNFIVQKQLSETCRKQGFSKLLDEWQTLQTRSDPVCRSLKGKYGILNYRMPSVVNCVRVIRVTGWPADKNALRAYTHHVKPHTSLRSHTSSQNLRY